MSIQDPTYGNPPERPPQGDPFGDAAPAPNASSDATQLKAATETVRDDLRSALDTAKRDLGAAMETAKRDFSAVKDEALGQFQNLKGQAGEQAGSLKDQAAGQVQSLKSQAQDQYQALKSQAEGQLSDAADKAKTLASEKVSELAGQARSFANEQKDLAARQLGGVVEAVSRVADELQGSQTSATVAGYAQDFAGSLRGLADTIQNKSVDDLVGMVQDFGRRQPLAFIGVAALVGFAASRFLLASRNRYPEPAPTAYDPGAMGTRPPSDFYAGRTEVDVDRSRGSDDFDDSLSPIGMSDNGRI